MDGYLPRKPEPVAAAGYLPSAWKGRGGELPTRAVEIRAGNSVALREGYPSSDPTVAVDFERIAYALLRCKSLLQEIEAAESRGPIE
jgi:hypothetical protein